MSGQDMYAQPGQFNQHGGQPAYGAGQPAGMNQAGLSGMMNNPMAAAGLNMGRQLLEKNVRSYIPGVTAFWTALQSYFDVNHEYVRNKLRRLAMPFSPGIRWEREVNAYDDTADSGSKFKPPVDDINAPDLYIPLMSFITFVLLTGLMKGTRMNFTPEALGDILTSALIVQILEVQSSITPQLLGVVTSPQVLIMKTALWLLQCPSLSVLDLVAYSGYKYVGLCINTLVGMLLGSLPYYVALLATGAVTFLFTQKSLQAVISAPDAKKQYLSMGAAGLQVLAMWWLGYSGEM